MLIEDMNTKNITEAIYQTMRQLRHASSAEDVHRLVYYYNSLLMELNIRTRYRMGDSRHVTPFVGSVLYTK